MENYTRVFFFSGGTTIQGGINGVKGGRERVKIESIDLSFFSKIAEIV